jgi:7,8-dihydropterin-6-yl-methyl-4-(beta-D-ribofuranosyl)aminobenzene 5'-phosphate synthase
MRKAMNLQIVYDNKVYREDLEDDWGFAAYIEVNYHRILFDTGSDGQILLNNMRKLRIDPKKIDTVFISHHHYDHTGGLSVFLRRNPDVRVYVPKSFRGVRRATEVVYIDKELCIDKDIYSTGELNDIEQSLFIKTSAGLVLIVGCSHPGLEKILPAAEKHGHIHLLIGGFHGFSDYKILKDIDYICPTHCTRHIREIAEHYPDKILRGGVGAKFALPVIES